MRLVPAFLNIEFEQDNLNKPEFLKEFSSITHNEEDQLGAWLKRAKARGDTKDSDQVLLTLIVELHRKFDELSASIKNEPKELLRLNSYAKIEAIGFDCIQIDSMKFKPNDLYYARIDMPIFPKRTMAMYLRGVSENSAKIEKMHDDDESDWNAYVTARERVMIRANKESKG
ncbi:hypothetical protein [Campylobacter majalis]|uniref:hypothetical protein n=1 Tax=Campylobacter majalis TaxID=2790656 RepID=UPI003D694389